MCCSICTRAAPRAGNFDGMLKLLACAQLVLRSINSSRSAFVSVTYYEDFFDAYDMGASAIVQAGILMKVSKLWLRTCHNHAMGSVHHPVLDVTPVCGTWSACMRHVHAAASFKLEQF